MPQVYRLQFLAPSSDGLRVAVEHEVRAPDAGMAIEEMGRASWLCPDSRHGWSETRSRGQGIDYWDLASGRLLWTASNPIMMSGEDAGLLVEFADGRVRFSKGAESLVSMVKGFEHRPFDPKRDAAFIER